MTTLESIANEALTTVAGGAGLPVRRAGNALPEFGTGPQIPKFVAGRQITPKLIPEFTAGRQTGWLLVD